MGEACPAASCGEAGNGRTWGFQSSPCNIALFQQWQGSRWGAQQTLVDEQEIPRNLGLQGGPNVPGSELQQKAGQHQHPGPVKASVYGRSVVAERNMCHGGQHWCPLFASKPLECRGSSIRGSLNIKDLNHELLLQHVMSASPCMSLDCSTQQSAVRCLCNARSWLVVTACAYI